MDVIVVGGGIVGLATAYQLLTSRPDLRVRVLERASRVGSGQSSRNSGVVHAGLYYASGSSRAVMCRRGKAEFEAFARAHDVPLIRTGKLVVAVDRSELPHLHALVERARTNGVEITELGPDGLRDHEPDVTGVAGAWTPETAVTDFGVACERLAELVRERGGEIAVDTEVSRIDEAAGTARVRTTTGDVEGRTVVCCAGLFADRLATASGVTLARRIVPFRGSWLRLRAQSPVAIRGNIYPVPQPGLPFLGVHLTRRISGDVWIGPNAVVAGARDGARPWSVDPRDAWDTIAFRGTWPLARQHAATAVHEVVRDRLVRSAVREVRKYVPAVAVEHVERGPWGVRAQLVEPDGRLVDDFVIHETARVVHVLNAPSPAATASLAIGAELRDRVLARVPSAD